MPFHVAFDPITKAAPPPPVARKATHHDIDHLLQEHFIFRQTVILVPKGLNGLNQWSFVPLPHKTERESEKNPWRPTATQPLLLALKPTCFFCYGVVCSSFWEQHLHPLSSCLITSHPITLRFLTQDTGRVCSGQKKRTAHTHTHTLHF